MDPLTALAGRPLAGGGPVTARFRAAGARDFAAAARHLLALPYGRISDRARYWLVLEEGRGTCTTKHALLADLAREQAIPVQLVVAIYEMGEENTPGVGKVLSRYGLTAIPEAHCFLRFEGERLDITGVSAGAAPIDRFLHEEPITVEQIGAYKMELHKRVLGEWVARGPHRLTAEEAWRIREECIAALSDGAQR